MGDTFKNAQDEHMTQLIKVLDEIKDYAVDELDSAPSSDMVAVFLEKLKTVYDDESFRHSYSIISSCLGMYQADERDSIPVVLARVVDLALLEKKTSKDARILGSLQKLLDHIELECLRLNRMDEIRNLAKGSKIQQKQTEAITQQVSEDTKILESKVKGFHEQSITILGIFSAIVVGFMAEISLFIKGFESLTPDNVYALLFYCTVVGIIVFDTLFMLIFFVAKIAGFSLAVSKHTKDSGLWLLRTFFNYPYIYCFNALAIIGAILLYIANSGN